MCVLKNEMNIPLSLAVWVADDQYDYVDEPNYISATSLLKSTKQLILSGRVPPTDAGDVDLSSRSHSAVGSAIHNSIEDAWVHRSDENLKKLGYPAGMRKRIKINPDPSTVTEDDIPVYLEQRSYKSIDGYNIGGMYDMVLDGRVRDTKTTGTYTWKKKSKDHDYIMQGSIYRWLNPEIITDDHMSVDFYFKDWSAMRTSDPSYPQYMFQEKVLPLKSIGETELFIKNKLADIERYKDATEENMPECNDRELWRDPPVYKYYKNPNKTDGRSTKNFENMSDAQSRLYDDGAVGIVIEAKSEPRACNYCPAKSICKQRERMGVK